MSSSASPAGPRFEEPPANRDAAYWASGGARLSVGDVPPEAMNLNVQGRRVNSPIQGFGKMWQKTYSMHLDTGAIAPATAIAEWKANFSKFWPAGNHFYGPITGLAPGEVALLSATMPGGAKLSTGVLVLYADEESFTLMTPEGHVFAGWVTFSAFEEDGGTVVQAQVLMRASDPLFELGLALGGHGKEDQHWQHTLTQLATHLGVRDARVETRCVCIDGRRQWSRAGNIRHNAGIRTTMYLAAAPLRWTAALPRRLRGGGTP